ncbi:hypothetical protein [Gemmiger formicilis]|uniref:hypothetical protein n=1 Tax=Gemmiger formicilis TaxID=745368 RepID=UPI003CCAA667
MSKPARRFRITPWKTSLDGKVWTLREDVARECSNGYYEYADGIRARGILA